MQELNTQSPTIPSRYSRNFLSRARLHQSNYRDTILKLPYDTYKNHLFEEDGKQGKNFYDGFGIFDAVEDYRGYNKPLYSNMLRSEHIPFNFFVPLDKNKVYCGKVFADVLGIEIDSVNVINIEYAPPGKEKYLNDNTSFDAYIEYIHSDGAKGVIGIEVKYTEKSYPLVIDSEQWKKVTNKDSIYYKITDKCHLYKPGATDILPTNKFRQVWRNHLLGESMLLTDNSEFKYFTSLTLFPSGNSHFMKTSKDYVDLLVSNDNKFIPLTYERFFELLNKYCPNNEFKEWIDYLTERYIVIDNQRSIASKKLK